MADRRGSGARGRNTTTRGPAARAATSAPSQEKGAGGSKVGAGASNTETGNRGARSKNEPPDKKDAAPASGRAARAPGGTPASPTEPAGATPRRVEQSLPAVSVGNVEKAPRRRLCRALQSAVAAVKLQVKEVSQAADILNPVVEELIRGIRQHEIFKDVEKLPSGSYYEKVKISKPDEFDIMLKMPIGRIGLESIDEGGSFYYVSFSRNPRGNPLQKFVENGRLSADGLLTELRQQIKNVLKDNVKNLLKDNEDISVERKKFGCPAVTLLIKKQSGRKMLELSVDIVLALEVETSWPKSTSDGLDIKDWLGTKARKEYRFKPIYLVPKTVKHAQIRNADTWRLSFSHVEKDILLKHGKERTCCERNGQKCCRKKCLKLLKYLMEILKRKHERNLADFCSYHAKTVSFHAFAKRPDDSQWNPEDLEACFDKLIEDFVLSLENAELKHFFIPSFNLYSPEEIERKQLQFLAKKLEDEKKNRYPVFEN